MSLSISPASPLAGYGIPSLNPTIDEIMAQSAGAAAQMAPQDVGSVDPTTAPISNDPALGGNVDITV